MQQLPSRSDVAAASNVCAEAKQADISAGVSFDCKEVATFSTAMAQLLVCLSKTLESIGQRLTLTSVPAKMKSEMARLGLSDHVRKWESNV